MTSTSKQLDPLDNPQMRKIIDDTISEYGEQNGALMVVLNHLQAKIGFITKPMQAYVAQKMFVPVSKVNGVVSFYSFFTTEPRGKHVVKFCIGTACYVGGSITDDRQSQASIRDRTRSNYFRWSDHTGSVPLCRRLQPGPGCCG